MTNQDPAAQERAAVVRFISARCDQFYTIAATISPIYPHSIQIAETSAAALRSVADAIERGDHERTVG